MLMRTLVLTLALLVAPQLTGAEQDSSAVDKDVVKMPLAEGVGLDDAIESMKLRANMLNMPLVAEMPLSKQLEAMGEESRRIEIFQFCNPLVAKRMVEADLNFAAYLPCRIAVIEDEQGRGWLVMVNLDSILAGSRLPPDLHREAVGVRDALMEIMQAGANGEL